MTEIEKLRDLARGIIQADKMNMLDDVSKKVEELAAEAREILAMYPREKNADCS